MSEQQQWLSVVVVSLGSSLVYSTLPYCFYLVEQIQLKNNIFYRPRYSNSSLSFGYLILNILPTYSSLLFLFLSYPYFFFTPPEMPMDLVIPLTGYRYRGGYRKKSWTPPPPTKIKTTQNDSMFREGIPKKCMSPSCVSFSKSFEVNYGG